MLIVSQFFEISQNEMRKRFFLTPINYHQLMTPLTVNYNEILKDEYYNEYQDFETISTWYNPLYWILDDEL